MSPRASALRSERRGTSARNSTAANCRSCCRNTPARPRTAFSRSTRAANSCRPRSTPSSSSTASFWKKIPVWIKANNPKSQPATPISRRKARAQARQQSQLKSQPRLAVRCLGGQHPKRSALTSSGQLMTQAPSPSGLYRSARCRPATARRSGARTRLWRRSGTGCGRSGTAPTQLSVRSQLTLLPPMPMPPIIAKPASTSFISFDLTGGPPLGQPKRTRPKYPRPSRLSMTFSRFKAERKLNRICTRPDTQRPALRTRILRTRGRCCHANRRDSGRATDRDTVRPLPAITSSGAR